jgi:nucleotide-binding universal stress UspA family protein
MRRSTRDLFENIVCGVDGSAEGFVALGQARQLLAPGGRLVAVTACEDALAVHAGLNAARVAADLRAEARTTSARAARRMAGLEHARAVVARGRPADVLRRIVASERSDLLVVGSHGTGRPLGMLLGSVATTMLHEAPCPVLVARRTNEPASFPRHVVVGDDGSLHAAEAAVVAAQLAERLGATLRVIVATGGKIVDVAAVAEQAEQDQRSPVAALEAAADTADLLVVGSRGLRGFAALGSVSERVAHRARSSVLVVRPSTLRRAERRGSAAVAR